MNLPERRREFIHHLAVFLSGNPAEKSIRLEMAAKSGNLEGSLINEWATCRTWSGIRGYATIEETEQQLIEFLDIRVE